MEKLINIEIHDGIVIGESPPHLSIDLNVAKKIVKQRLKLQNGEDYPVLFIISMKLMNREAREYMKKEGTKGIVAGAFLVNSGFTKTILNFFISVTKPEVPAKIFTKKEEAVKWLQQYKQITTPKQ